MIASRMLDLRGLWASLSLTVRVMIWACISLAFASTLLLVASTHQDARFARDQIHEHLDNEIESLLPAISEWVVVGDHANIETMLRQRVQRSDVRHIGWTSDRGKVLEAVDKDAPLSAPGWFVRWTGIPSPASTRSLSIGGRNYGQLTVEMTATPALNRLWDAFLSRLAILGLALVLSVAGIFAILRRGLHPLSVLTRGAGLLEGGDYSQRIPRHGSPELLSLIDAFNHMTVGIASAQGALRDEAERLSVTLSSIGDAVIATNVDGNVEFMNPVAEAMTGWTAREAEGRSIQQVFVVVNEVTREPVDCPVGRAIREGVIAGLANHTLLISRDGTERPIADSAAPIRHADGVVHGAVLVFRDQGPERAAARSLRESEEAYRGLFDAVGEAIFVMDAQGRFLDANQAAEVMYGFPRSAFIGRSADFISAPGMNDSALLPVTLARALAGELQYLEFWGRRANHEVFPLEVRAVRGNYRGQDVVIASAIDITERRRAEEQLRKLSLAVEQSPDSILITDLKGNIEYVNEAFVRDTGYGRREVIGMNPRLLQSGKTPRDTFVAQWDALTQGRSWSGEFINRRKDGREFTAWTSISPLRQADGRIVHFVGIMEDVTERKRLAQELERHRDRLEDLVAARTAELSAARAEALRMARVKSDFLANMSHELRTPLNGVLGMARIGARDSVGRANHDVFVRIQNSGEHLLGVINDILDFSKIDAGKLAIERQPFALVAAIDNAISFVAGTARQKGLQLEVSVAPGLPEWVSGDGQRLQQILINLLSNAIKFTAQGEVRLRVAGENDDVYFKVIDTGVGMSQEQVERLFQPFEQADSSTTRRYGGTGLGLAISQNLAHLMNGNIDVDCTLGAGCSFTLRLPLPKAAPAAPAHAVPVGGQLRLSGQRFLAAEDVEVNRLILDDLLGHEGAAVVFAEDGQQALDRVREEGAGAFDAVLMDVQMPVMNGFDAARYLSRLAPGLPIIGLTAHALAEERENCLAAGMVDHVAKPIDTEALVAAILRHVRPRETSRTSGAAGDAGTTPAAAQESVTAGPAPADALVNWDGLLAQYSGREAFVIKLATMAVDGQREVPAKLRAAAGSGDFDGLAFTAHSLKSIGGNLMARGVRELAESTERAARRSDPQAASQAEELACLVETLLAELALRIGR